VEGLLLTWRHRLGSIGCLNDESSNDDAEHADDEGGVGECPELGSTGCLNDESSDDDAEHADDEGGVSECLERTPALLERAPEDAAEASNLAIPDDVSMLESSVPGVSMDLLPNPNVADPAEPPQVLNVTEILKRNHVTHSEAKLVQQVLKVLVDMRQATNPVPGVQCFELQPGRGIGTMWMQVPRARVADGDVGLKQQQRRADEGGNRGFQGSDGRRLRQQQRDRRGLWGTCAEGSFQRSRHQRAALLERGGKFQFALMSTPIKGRSLISLFFFLN